MERTCLGREIGKRGIVPVRSVADNISISVARLTRTYPTYRSRMNRILSFANNPKLDRHEKPNNASVKKNIPAQMQSIRSQDELEPKTGLAKAILETCNVISNVVEEETADHYHTNQYMRNQKGLNGTRHSQANAILPK